jgi:hypothetical protein
MKRIFTAVLGLLCIALSAHAQSDSIRYKAYLGTYTITTTSFPVRELTILWQDSVLAFNADGKRGVLTHVNGSAFSFQQDDHSGTVTFRESKHKETSNITIVMDGVTYVGTKKP